MSQQYRQNIKNQNVDEFTFEKQEDDTTFFGHKDISRDSLPIYKNKQQILYSVEKFSCTIIIAETGSGKTTQIPQFLVDAGYALNNKRIGITLPRRMGALSCATRVAAEMQTQLGDQVGYHIRFNNNVNPYTMVKFLTDGMLIKEMMSDPLLNEYSVIIVDDMHERSLQTDTILGLLKKIRRKRKDLKLIISSATMDAQQIYKYFQDQKHEDLTVNILGVEGRLFPVQIHYLSMPCKNYVTKAVETTLMIHQTKEDGDILVFLTGQEEIETFISLIKDNLQNMKLKKKLVCCKLYANMPLEAQMAIFEPQPQNTRKVIVSTNLAESSVTIEKIVYVIDSCFVKLKHYDYLRGCESLLVCPISKSSGNQRSGRAGRVRPGECFRLCTQDDYNNLYENSTPEMLRCQLSSLILQLKSLGIGNLMGFDFLDKPSEESMVRALELLYSLKAIDIDGNLTNDIGAKLAELPLEPKLGVILLNACKEEFGCAQEILALVAMLSVQNVFYSNSPAAIVRSKKKLGAKEGDHISLINIFIRYQKYGRKEKSKMCVENNINEKSQVAAQQIHDQLKEYLIKQKLPINSAADDIECVLRCIATGLFANVAQRQAEGTYRGIFK